MQVQTLLHRQGGKCFYCRKKLSQKNATIEHIIPNCMGRYEGFTNLVACCAAMNSTLQGLPPKYKIEIILNCAGRSACPNDIDSLKLIDESSALNTSFNDPVYIDKYADCDQKVDIDLPDDFTF